MHVAGKPQITEKTDNTVTLSWIRSNAIGASSLLGYTVEMFGRNSTEGWVQVDNRIQNTTYQVLGLSSGVSYYFAVRAENSHGMSGPSQLSEPITMGVVREMKPFLHLISFRCLLILPFNSFVKRGVNSELNLTKFSLHLEEVFRRIL